MSSCDAVLSPTPARSFEVAPHADPSLGDSVRRLTRQLRDATQADDAGDLDFGSLQRLFGALCEFYAADVTQREKITPINTIEHASPTAVLMTTTALLRGANVELFELGMWQTWSGMK